MLVARPSSASPLDGGLLEAAEVRLHGAGQASVLACARGRCVGSASSVRLCWPSLERRVTRLRAAADYSDRRLSQLGQAPSPRQPRQTARAAGTSPSPRRPGRLARSTAFFSIATAASRVAGLVREIVAAGYFGVKGPMSAFTVAFQVPNLVRSLFADAALQPAFVPIFTEQLEKGNHRRPSGSPRRCSSSSPWSWARSPPCSSSWRRLMMPLFAPGLRRARSRT